MARTTAPVVLQECILDIKAGHWLCGDLMQAAEANGNKKPHGCAVALLVVNAKLAPVVIQPDDNFESGLVAFCPSIHNPSHYFKTRTDAPATRLHALKKALVALALAMPVEDREHEYDPDTDEDVPLSDAAIRDMSVEALESMVIEYNDSAINDEEAEAWFKKAYEIAS